MNGKTKWVTLIGSVVVVILAVSTYLHALDREVNTNTNNICALQEAKILAAQERKDSAKERSQMRKEVLEEQKKVSTAIAQIQTIVKALADKEGIRYD